MRRPTARSIAGSAGLATAFAFGLRAAFPRALLWPWPPASLFSCRRSRQTAFLHVHENRLQCRGKCDHNFILVKIGRNGVSRNSLV